jgi:hypothetical protein
MGRSRALRRRPRALWLLCGFSGVLAGGLVALGVVLLVVGIVAGQRGMPGPGVVSIIGHGVAAVAAVLLQRRADHTRGTAAAGAALAVVALTVGVLGVQWLV